MGVAAALEKQQPDSLRLTLLLARAGSPVVSTARHSSRILTAPSPQTKYFFAKLKTFCHAHYGAAASAKRLRCIQGK